LASVYYNFVINVIVVEQYTLLHQLSLFDFRATMNDRLNVGRGDLKSSTAVKSLKTEPVTPVSVAGHQPDSVQRDKGSRFSSVGVSDSRAEQSEAKNTEVEKNSKSVRSAPDDSDNSATEAQLLQEKKFSGRCRLFVGNLPSDLSESEFQKFFEPFGELNEVFLNAPRGFGFVRLVSMEYRHYGPRTLRT